MLKGLHLWVNYGKIKYPHRFVFDQKGDIMDTNGQKRALLINMRPDRIRCVLNGDVTMDVVLREIRLSPPFKLYICCSKNVPKGEKQLVVYDDSQVFPADGKVVAECVCDNLFPIYVFADNGAIQDWNFHDLRRTGYTYHDLSDRILQSKLQKAWALSLSNLKQYAKPRDVYALGVKNVPHGWCYATERDWGRYWKESEQCGANSESC